MTRYQSPARRVDRVSFGKPTHHYVDANGERIPGVTTILGDGLPKPALVAWAGNTTAAYAVDRWEELADLKPSERLDRLKKCRYEDRDAAARRGTEVHDLGERLMHGEAVEVPEELRGHVQSYARFLEDYDPEPVIVERAVVNYAVGYAGTLDAVADIPGIGRVLFDIKTTRSGVYGETALQLAAYRYAEVYVDHDGEKPMPEVDETWVVWVRADGYSVVPMRADRAAFLDFQRVAQVARLAGRLDALKLPEIDAAQDGVA